MLLLEMLKYHENECQDSGCECKDKLQKVEQDAYSQRDSMMSRTALLSVVNVANDAS